MKIFLVFAMLIQSLCIPVVKLSNVKPVDETLYFETSYQPVGWYETLSNAFYPKIEQFYQVKNISANFGVLFNRDYGWWHKTTSINESVIKQINEYLKTSNLNSNLPINYGIESNWTWGRVYYDFWIAVNEFKQIIPTYNDWGTWYGSNAVSGISLNLKVNVENTITKEMNEITNWLDNKKAQVIYTPNPNAENILSNQKRVLDYIHQTIGARKFKWLQKFTFNYQNVILQFDCNFNGYMQSRKIKFNFRYKLLTDFQNLRKAINQENNTTLNIVTHTYSLAENETQIKTKIQEKFANKVINNVTIVNLITKYHFLPSNSSLENDYVDVYFALSLVENFSFLNEKYDEAFNYKITFKINYLLDEAYFQKDMEERITFTTKGKKLDGEYNGYEVYSDEVIVKFRTNKVESEVLFVNSQPVGVVNGVFTYVLKDGYGKQKNENNKVEEELNTYEVKLMKKDALDPHNNLQPITWIKKIMIRKKAPQLDIKLWADNDEQNPNEIVGMVVYDPKIETNFQIDKRWLQENEKHLLANVNGLSGSLMGIHLPNWDEKDQLIDEATITWEYQPMTFTKDKQKIALDFVTTKSVNKLIAEKRNKRQFFSHQGIFRFKIADKLETEATYYHLNLGINNANNLQKTTGETILNNIKDNLYYFWDSKLGKALINYLQGISFYLHNKTKERITWETYQTLSMQKQKEYQKITIGGIGKYTAEELLKMSLHVVHFNISRMIRDLQYDHNGELEDQLKKDNGGKDQLEEEDKIDKGIDDETEKPVTDDQEKFKKEQEKQKEQWNKIINKENKIIKQITTNKQIKMISLILVAMIIILIFSIIFYLRKRKKIV